MINYELYKTKFIWNMKHKKEAPLTLPKWLDKNTDIYKTRRGFFAKATEASFNVKKKILTIEL